MNAEGKSILIFDTPTRCYDCPLYTSIDEGEYGFCDDRNILKQKEAQEKIRFDRKPIWCPLRPLPKQFTTDEILMAKDVKTAIEMRAYNDCLEEIIGETE